MSPAPHFSIEFEMSDALMTRAVRESCVAALRKHATPWNLLVVAASGAVFALAVARESHWLWWIAGLAPLVFVLLGLGWLVAYAWLPRAARAKLAHLPHRQVRVEASAAGIAFETANEKLEVAWREFASIEHLPGFRIVGLKSGTRIPIPADLLRGEDTALLEARVAQVAGG